MNFLVCDNSYVSNHLFDVSGWIMIISLFVLFIFLYIKSCKLVNKLVKNKVLRVVSDIILFLIFVMSYFYVLVLVLMYSETLIIKDDSWDLPVGYEEYRYYFRFQYLIMSITLLLNFIWIYYYIFKRYLSKVKDKLIIKKKKKYGLLIYGLITVLSIGVLFGSYCILDSSAEEYDYYHTDCGNG